MADSKKSESARYWQKHLPSWEASAYRKDAGERANWWDRLSTLCRGDKMYVRMSTALELLRPHLAGKTVLDAGCASGRFAFQLHEAGAARVFGVDTSSAAVGRALERRANAGLSEELEFRVGDLIHPVEPLPVVDIVTALGVIEYFSPEAMSTFLGSIRARHILLDFPDLRRRNEFPTWFLRQVYVRVNRLPGLHLYSLDQFARIAEPFGFSNLRLLERNDFYYVTNLPE